MPEPDAFFKFPPALGLAENHQLYRFVLVDKVKPPTTLAAQGPPRRQESVEERYRNMLENIFVERRLTFYESGFTDFLMRSNNVMSRGEMIAPVGIT